MGNVMHTGRKLKTSNSGKKKYVLPDAKLERIKNKIYKRSVEPYINDIAREATNYMKGIVYNDWYREYKPIRYERTMDMYNSIVYKKATPRKNGSVGTTVGWDKRMIRIFGNHHIVGRAEMIDIIESSGMTINVRGRAIMRQPTHARERTEEFVRERFNSVKVKEKIVRDFNEDGSAMSSSGMRIYMTKSQIKKIK